MKLPTFMILGAAKAGTTSLAYYLGQHPDICMSLPKEPWFFESEYEKGAAFYFENYFRHYKGELHVGEARHRNLYLGYVPQRIKETLEDPYFIVICRNPVDRAISHYMHNWARIKNIAPFEKEIEINLKRLKTGPYFMDKNDAVKYLQFLEPDLKNGTINDQSYIDTGYYAEQIERYIKIFGRNRIKIIFSDDLLNHTSRTVNDIFTFLGLNIYHVDIMQVNKQVHWFIPLIYKYIAMFPCIKLIPVRWRYRTKVLIGKSIKMKPMIEQQTKEFLVEHFKPHNKKLEELTGRDLSSWNVLK